MLPSVVVPSLNQQVPAGNVESVRALIAAHADVTIQAEQGVTALHAAAELGNMELVQLLLQVW